MFFIGLLLVPLSLSLSLSLSLLSLSVELSLATMAAAKPKVFMRPNILAAERLREELTKFNVAV